MLCTDIKIKNFSNNSTPIKFNEFKNPVEKRNLYIHNPNKNFKDKSSNAKNCGIKFKNSIKTIEEHLQFVDDFEIMTYHPDTPFQRKQFKIFEKLIEKIDNFSTTWIKSIK